MEYIDFTKKKIELHKEMENAIKDLMKEKSVTEIDLTTHLDTYDTAWLIRSNISIEEVQVASIKLDGNKLLYKAVNEWGIDDEWMPFDVCEDVIAATIDSVYDAVFQRI